MINILHNGIKNTCHTSFQFKGGDFENIKPEYLLTSIIAQEIINNKPSSIIQLEMPTKEVIDHCIPWFKNNNHYSIESLEKQITRKGKIDLVILERSKQDVYLKGDQVKHLIEIKCVSPTKNAAQKDFIRIFDFFNLKDINTGGSLINESFFVSIEKAKKSFFKDGESPFKKRIKNKYVKWITEILPPNINFTVSLEEAFSETYTVNDIGDSSEGDDPYDFHEGFHYYLSIVIKFKKT